jgi:hypothetical protein
MAFVPTCEVGASIGPPYKHTQTQTQSKVLFVDKYLKRGNFHYDTALVNWKQATWRMSVYF